ncbi:disulfide bond formation protein DsbA [Bifidobacterium pullorum subsp. saeculare]|uniref:Disulfide bond formation protein DsbA n=1 Tax=Bifidobacterium pullorum subsp. saeculare TaxID=78257 RepID=A0A938WYX2_9BIFI|nr:thioredoxin domain-containing protein [Bifidobacterium pullorum]MBM6699578.1 disulfide bond formation protein DsbA [Bifidobacterium pullorum subsp. saeculare]
MAQKNNTDRRMTRAQRKAAEQAAAQAAAEQAAKERRQQTIVGAIVAVVVVALIAVAGIAVYRSTHSEAAQATKAAKELTVDQAKQKVQKAPVKPARADDQGGILISKDGYGTKAPGAPTVSVYMDFICPGCGNLNRQLDPTLIAMMDAGQLNLDLHIMSFGDANGWSTDEYSNRSANSALYIADHDDDPDHLLAYISNLFAEDFQPEEGPSYVPTSNDMLKEQALKAGVPASVADKAFTREYDDWLSAINTYTPKRSDLWNVSGRYEGSMTTPTVQINGHFWDLNQLSVADMDLKTGFLTSVGLKEDQVGKAGQMPSIGAKGKPISVTGA